MPSTRVKIVAMSACSSFPLPSGSKIPNCVAAMAAVMPTSANSDVAVTVSRALFLSILPVFGSRKSQ